MTRCYDLVVLGGGTAGLVSASIAAGIGARVALVERGRLGGDCLWTGCVPSKALIAAARRAHAMRTAAAVGLASVDPVVDFAAVMDHVHAAIAAIAPHDSAEALTAKGVEVVAGEGRFAGGSEVEVGGRRLGFASAIVATGSAPAGSFTTDDVWSLRALPRRLAVVGGGATGCELAQAFARLGASVVLYEAGDRLLAREEPEASALVRERLEADGVDVRLRAAADAPDMRPGAPAGGGDARIGGAGRSSAAVEGGDGRIGGGAGRPSAPGGFDCVLQATGRRPGTADLGAAAAGIELDASGAVVVDERLRTSAPRIFAAGDVTGGPGFTHVAAHHARVATVNALFGTRTRVDTALPRVTFCAPEVASVGLTAAQAHERWGARAVVARSDYADIDRAIADGDTTGFALLVAGPRGRLVGATVAAPRAGETIAALTARVRAGDRIDDVSHTVHAYPTFADGPARAADEHLRARYAARRYRALAGPVLLARRALRR